MSRSDPQPSMAERVAAFDWAATPLGPAERWSGWLKALVELVLGSPQIASLVCGPERLFIYNDAAAAFYGDRHPRALGRPLGETFPEGWIEVGPVYDRVFAGESVHLPAQALDVAGVGAGDVFDAYLTPVREEDGRVAYAHMTGFEVGAKLRAEAALRDTGDRLQVLVEELQHRTRNLIAVIRTVAARTLRSSSDLGDFEAQFNDRLAALGRVQGLLSRLHEGERVGFDALLRSELDALGSDGDRIVLDGPAGVEIRSRAVQLIAMALHELGTNAAKYGALGQDGARLSVTWRVERDAQERRRLHVHWVESGVVMPPPGVGAQGGGQGRELIEHALPYQLGARTGFELGPDGVRCRLELPLA